MSAKGGGRMSWQNHEPGSESIPLRDRSPDTSVLHPSEISFSDKERLKRAAVAGELKRHTLALWLILIYAFIAILSWSITCVLCYRPIGVPTYFDQTGNYSKSHYEVTDNWRKAASVGQSIVGVISIPVTSAICAKAVAVYCQRRSDAKMPSLSLRQTLVLADKGWTDIATLLNVVRPSTSRRTRSPLLMLSAGLVAIGFVIPIIQTSLVGTEHVSVLSEQDVGDSTIIGSQVTPQALKAVSNASIMDDIISSTITGKLTDKQPFLWSSKQSSSSILSVGENITNSSSFNDIPISQFIATFPIGTDTGVIRELALRLNVSVRCELVPQSDFPSPCPGDSPFDQTFTNINISTSTPFGDLDHPHYRARVCAPGNIESSPWKDTSDRQDISEELWLDYQRTLSPADSLWGITDGGSNYTQHCYGDSTLGYFELPNYWNGHVVGPLLDKVPPNGPNLTYQNGDPQQLTAGTPGGEAIEGGVPGPFLTAILAIFGPNSFFTTTATSSNWTRTYSTLELCNQLRYPFTGLAASNQVISSPTQQDLSLDWTPSYTTLDCPPTDPSDDPAPPLLRAIMNWMPNFGEEDRATAALTLATYAAGNAILNIGTGGASTFYEIWTSPGTSIQKPVIALAGIVIVSLLLIIQITGLTLLAIYASRNVTWTSSLDSFAMLRLGAEIGRENMPAVSTMEAKNAKVLDEQKGWVGDIGFEGREAEMEIRELGLGGQGGVRDKTFYRMVREKGSIGDAV